MTKKILFFILPSGLLFIFVMSLLFWNPSSTPNDIVKRDDIEIHLSNIKKLKDSTFFMTVEIKNESPLHLEENEISIQRKNYTHTPSNNPNSKGAGKNSTSDYVSSSYTEHRDSKQSVDSGHPEDVQIDNTKGNLQQIPAKDSVKLDITFRFNKNTNEPISIVFTSNEIRDDRDYIKTYYTTIVKEVKELNE